MRSKYIKRAKDWRVTVAVWDLESARWAYDSGNYKRSAQLLFKVMGIVVKEPKANSEEYINGEREKAQQEDKPEEEEILLSDSELFQGEYDGPETARDDDGYLIR